jgi:hypothetical protein
LTSETEGDISVRIETGKIRALDVRGIRLGVVKAAGSAEVELYWAFWVDKTEERYRQ